MIKTREELFLYTNPISSDKRSSLIESKVKITGNQIELPFEYDSLEEFKSEIDYIAFKFAFDFVLKKHIIKESLLTEFADFVDWDFISRKYNLSEEFIETFEDMLSWPNMFLYQNLSEGFKKRSIDKITVKIKEKANFDFLCTPSNINDYITIGNNTLNDTFLGQNVYTGVNTTLTAGGGITVSDANDSNDSIIYNSVVSESDLSTLSARVEQLEQNLLEDN